MHLAEVHHPGLQEQVVRFKSLHAHVGANFFPEGGKNASKIVIPPKMALGEGILFALLGEG